MNDPLDDSIAPSQANNLDIEDGDLEQDNRAIGRFENPGVPVLFGGHKIPTPLLAMAPPAPLETTVLMSQVDDNDYFFLFLFFFFSFFLLTYLLENGSTISKIKS